MKRLIYNRNVSEDVWQFIIYLIVGFAYFTAWLYDPGAFTVEIGMIDWSEEL